MKNKVSTKSKICDVAINLFSQQGYDLTSMDEIAAGAGVAKGTLYYHFKSKEAIFAYIIEDGVTAIYRTTQETTGNIENPLEEIMAIIKSQMEIAMKNRPVFRMIIRELWGKEFRHESVRKSLKKYLIDMSKIIEKAQNQGLVKKGDSMLMAYNIFGALVGTGVYEIMMETSMPENEIVEKSVEFILNGIK